MTTEIAIVLGVLIVALILFISEIIRMDLVALLVLGALAIFGVVNTEQAFAGFSNSAVITVWAMFILSEGLTRTGIADVIGRQVMRAGGSREVPMILVIMIAGAVLMANISPVTMNWSKATSSPSSSALTSMRMSRLLPFGILKENC